MHAQRQRMLSRPTRPGGRSSLRRRRAQTLPSMQPPRRINDRKALGIYWAYVRRRVRPLAARPQVGQTLAWRVRRCRRRHRRRLRRCTAARARSMAARRMVASSIRSSASLIAVGATCAFRPRDMVFLNASPRSTSQPPPCAPQGIQRRPDSFRQWNQALGECLSLWHASHGCADDVKLRANAGTRARAGSDIARERAHGPKLYATP